MLYATKFGVVGYITVVTRIRGCPSGCPVGCLVVLSGAGDTPTGSLQLVPLLDRRLGQRILKKPAGLKPEDILRSLSEDLRKGAVTGDGAGQAGPGQVMAQNTSWTMIGTDTVRALRSQ